MATWRSKVRPPGPSCHSSSTRRSGYLEPSSRTTRSRFTTIPSDVSLRVSRSARTGAWAYRSPAPVGCAAAAPVVALTVPTSPVRDVPPWSEIAFVGSAFEADTFFPGEDRLVSTVPLDRSSHVAYPPKSNKAPDKTATLDKRRLESDFSLELRTRNYRQFSVKTNYFLCKKSWNVENGSGTHKRSGQAQDGGKPLPGVDEEQLATSCSRVTITSAPAATTSAPSPDALPPPPSGAGRGPGT